MSENTMRVTYNSEVEIHEQNFTARQIADGRWHQFAFTASEDIVQVIVDFKSATTMDVPWTKLTMYTQVPYKIKGE